MVVSPWLVPALVGVNLLLVLLLALWLILRKSDHGAERMERELRDELTRSAQGTRLELGSALSQFQQTLLTQQGDIARTQNEQIDSFRTQLAAMQGTVAQALQTAASAQTAQSHASREAQDVALRRFAELLNEQLRALSCLLYTSPSPRD